MSQDETAYHLLLDPPEVEIAARALHLLISDEAHEPTIRTLAREVLELLEAEPGGVGAGRGADEVTEAGEAESGGVGVLTVPLTEPQMKIAHTAVKLLLLDTQREQESERQLLHAILGKLPDEHALRAIEL